MQMVWLEELVPKDHLLRKIDAAVDFEKIYEMVEELYSEDNGRPSIDSGQINADADYQPNIETRTWWDTEWKSITLK